MVNHVLQGLSIFDVTAPMGSRMLWRKSLRHKNTKLFVASYMDDPLPNIAFCSRMARFCSKGKIDNQQLSNGLVYKSRARVPDSPKEKLATPPKNGHGPKLKKNGFSYQDPATGKTWKKVLYEQNPFPDNYTPDECFLAAIEKNKNLHKYTFKQCLQGSCQVRTTN